MSDSSKKSSWKVAFLIGIILIVGFVATALVLVDAQAKDKVPAQIFSVKKTAFEHVIVDHIKPADIYFIGAWIPIDRGYTIGYEKRDILISPTKQKTKLMTIAIDIALDKKISGTAISVIFKEKPSPTEHVKIATRVTIWVTSKKEKAKWERWLREYTTELNPAGLKTAPVPSKIVAPPNG